MLLGWIRIALAPFCICMCAKIDVFRTPKVLFWGQKLPQFYFFQDNFTFFLLLIPLYKHCNSLTSSRSSKSPVALSRCSLLPSAPSGGPTHPTSCNDRYRCRRCCVIFAPIIIKRRRRRRQRYFEPVIKALPHGTSPERIHRTCLRLRFVRAWSATF